MAADKLKTDKLAKLIKQNHQALVRGIAPQMTSSDLRHSHRLHFNVILVQKHVHEVNETSLGMKTRWDTFKRLLRPDAYRTYMWQLVAIVDPTRSPLDLRKFLQDESRLDMDEPSEIASLRKEFFGKSDLGMVLRNVWKDIEKGDLAEKDCKALAKVLAHAACKISMAREVLNEHEEQLFPTGSTSKRAFDLTDDEKSTERPAKKLKVGGIEHASKTTEPQESEGSDEAIGEMTEDATTRARWLQLT